MVCFGVGSLRIVNPNTYVFYPLVNEKPTRKIEAVKSKISLLHFILIIIFSLLVFRLGQLTIVQGLENRNSADTQRIRIKNIPAERGIILDRNLKQLTYNVPVFKLCPVNKTECSSLSRDESLRIEAEGRDNDVVIGIGRTYPFAEATANLLGYLGEVSPDNLSNNYCKTPNGLVDKYEIGEMLGRTGIEEQYECFLRGNHGGELIEVNTEGKILRKIGRKEATSGKNLQLSIDINLQKIAYDALEGRKGAIIASSPTTGEIYALVSSPGFDPNVLTGSIQISDSDKKIQEIFGSNDQPLFNRAVSGVYPPGSTFKIITATSGLEEKEISEQTTIVDTGVISVGAFKYSNWFFTQYGKTEGAVNVVTALKRSNDIYFYKLGELVGPESIIDWSKTFRLGKTGGIDLPEEAPGFLPDPTKEWYLGNTYHLAIGQGALGVTPLQINQMTSIIASGGKWCKPHLRFDRPPECFEIGISNQTVQIITNGMIAACSSGGTAYPLFSLRPQVACKTGTAEFGDPLNNTHAWLTAFAPADNPKIVVTVLVEGAGEGSAVAAPIARKVLDEYYKNSKF